MSPSFETSAELNNNKKFQYRLALPFIQTVSAVIRKQRNLIILVLESRKKQKQKTTASKQMSKKKRRKTQGDAVPPTFVISPVVKFLVVI